MEIVVSMARCRVLGLVDRRCLLRVILPGSGKNLTTEKWTVSGPKANEFQKLIRTDN